MPDQSVVEELLEKGARALAGVLGVNPADIELGGSKECVNAVLDAVFPGWREGITREWCAEVPGVGLVDYGTDEHAARARNHSRLGVQLVIRSAWVPVEEGTDG